MKTMKRFYNYLKSSIVMLLLISMSIPCHAFDLDGITSVGAPTLAYSVRKLNSSYSGPALRVRSGDDATLIVDVYFDSNNIVSLSSPVSANGGGAATSTTLGTWIGSNTAFVVTWYDQSGNGRNASSAYSTTGFTNYSGVRFYKINNALTLTSGSPNGTLTNALAVKKYTITNVNAVNNSNVMTITTIPTSSVGNTGGSAGTAVTSGYPNASSKWQLLNNIIVGDGIPEGTMLMSSAQLPTSTTGNVQVQLSNNVTLSAGSTITMYDNVGSNYQPGNVLVANDGRYIGTIQSIGDDGKSIVLTSNAVMYGTFAINTWGVSNEPILVKQGVLQTYSNGMTAIRFVNGGVSGSGLIVPSFTNDGSGSNLQNVVNMDLFMVAQQRGNTTNIAAMFNTNSPTSTTPGKLQTNIGTGGNTLTAYSTVAATSASFTNGTLLGLQYNLTGDAMKIYSPKGTTIADVTKTGIFSSTATPPVTTPFDASQIQIFGHTGHFNRNFEGLAAEAIYWGSTNASNPIISATDAATLQSSQSSIYGIGTSLTTVSPINNNLEVSVIPTVSRGLYTISGNNIGAHYEVVSLLGQVVKNGTIHESSKTIDLSACASGTYLLRLHLNNSQSTTKIVKL